MKSLDKVLDWGLRIFLVIIIVGYLAASFSDKDESSFGVTAVLLGIWALIAAARWFYNNRYNRSDG